MSESIELIAGHTYEGKQKRRINFVFDTVINDRHILHMGCDTVQYDSPTVRPGKRYPTVSKEKFIKWLGKDVTDEMPKGDWRPWK